MVSMVRERQKIPLQTGSTPDPSAQLGAAPVWAEAGPDPLPHAGEPAEAAPTSALTDWITLWQSELTALAADREMREAAQALIALWDSAAHSLAATFPARADDRPSGRPRPAEPPRPAPAAAAPAAGDDGAELARLRARLAELESRIAELERPKPGRPVQTRRRPA